MKLPPVNKKHVIVAGVALTAAVLTTLFFSAVLPTQVGEASTDAQVVAALAVRDLPRGTRLTPEQVELKNIDEAQAPAGLISSAEELDGRFLMKSVLAGAPITQAHFPSSESGGMAAAIPPGMRAVSLHVEEYAGVTEIVEPGDRVDIYMASDRRYPGRDDIKVDTVLENIEVIDTGRRAQQGRQAPLPVVTVIVDSGDAQAVTLADQKGAIRLTLRNPTDGNISIQADNGGAPMQATAARP